MPVVKAVTAAAAAVNILSDVEVVVRFDALLTEIKVCNEIHGQGNEYSIEYFSNQMLVWFEF